MPGDIVLDSFAGSGTTGAVAHKMGRRWIMVELGEHYPHTHNPAPEKGDRRRGPRRSHESNWMGGRWWLSLFPPCAFAAEEDKWGNWVISKEYNAAMLAEAFCKLEGFTYAPSDTVYWQQGIPRSVTSSTSPPHILTPEQLQQLNDEVGPERSTARSLHCLPWQGRSISEPDREENPETGAFPLRVGP